MELMVQEDNFIIKTLSAHEELEAGYRLRHEVFSEELKWVPVSPDGMEVDRYDSGPVSYIGVFDEWGTLQGYARLITSPNTFMIDREFACLLEDGMCVEKSPDMAEITRLCVRKRGRKGDLVMRVSNFLYKGIYLWSTKMDIRHLVMVVDNRYYRLLRFTGFPVRTVGDFIEMPDSVRAAVIRLDWREFDRIAVEKKPEFFHWISTQPDPVPSPVLLRGLY